MRVAIGFIALFLFAVFSGVIIIASGKSPEKLVLGKWEEVSWEFEKLNANPNEVSEDLQRQEICQDMLIHKAESWIFEENGKFSLKKNRLSDENLTWQLKGRGHILLITHENEKTEQYQIQELNDEFMVLHFGFDLQVKGIVKMTFKKLSDKNA